MIFDRRTFLSMPLLLGANQCARGSDTHTPGQLTVLFASEPEHLDPRFPGDALGSTLSRLVFRGLFDSDPATFVPTFDLAAALELVSPTVFRVHMRDAQRFHDGTAITAHDVAATYSAVLSSALSSPLRGTYSRVFRRAEALDDRTVEFKLVAPDGSHRSLMQLPIVRAADARSSELIARAGNERRFVGSGAMRVAQLDRGRWEFQRARDDGGAVHRLRCLSMGDANTLALRLLHRGADLAEVKPELLPLIERSSGFRLWSARGAGLTYLGFRNDHAWLQHRDVRRAIASAVDRESLRLAKFGRHAVTARTVLPPSHWAHHSVGIPPIEFDPVAARRTLRAQPPRTEPLVLRVSSVRFAVTIARAIATMLEDVGIAVEVRPSELSLLLADLRAGRYDMTILTMPDLSDPWGLEWLFASSSQPTPQNPRAGGNRWRYRNVALDQACMLGRRALTPDERAPHYAIVQQILADDLPVLPLWHADVVFGGRSTLGDLHPRGDSQLGFLLDARV